MDIAFDGTAIHGYLVKSIYLAAHPKYMQG